METQQGGAHLVPVLLRPQVQLPDFGALRGVESRVLHGAAAEALEVAVIHIRTLWACTSGTGSAAEGI